ncbi:MAG: hypothetical protein M1511_19855 [Deltaproteobacteria bacterium]|nr:hypothetical protein [Deltaproteobacteria bacterium]
MTRRNYALITGVMLLTILLTNFGIFVASGIARESLDQSRTECLSRCNEPTGDLMSWGGGGDDSILQLRAICVQKCENNYWKQWDKEMNNIGKN